MNLTFRPVDVDSDADAATIQAWVTQPYARYWGMLTATPEEVRTAYADIATSAHQEAFLGLHDGEPVFLAERYDPAQDPVGKHYAVGPGDVGMHLLVAPVTTPIAGFTRFVMDAVIDFLFADQQVQRIVVEPDVRNDKIQDLNADVGFKKAKIIGLPDKDAWLSFLTRAQFNDARNNSPSVEGYAR